jgi:hypothetical protein
MLTAWDELQERLGLMALGYRRILLCELECPNCGAWRGAIENESDTYPCPGECGSACKLIVCCDRAWTRRAETEIPWTRVSPPVSYYIKRQWTEALFPRPRRVPVSDRHRRKAQKLSLGV